MYDVSNPAAIEPRDCASDQKATQNVTAKCYGGISPEAEVAGKAKDGKKRMSRSEISTCPRESLP